MIPIYSNNARTTISKKFLATDDTIELTSVSKFPIPNIGRSYVLLTLEDSIGHIEVVKASVLADRIYTLIERGLQGTWPQEWPAGSLIENRFTAENVNAINSQLEINLDKMTNRSYPYTTKSIELTNGSTTKLTVKSGALTLFERNCFYDNLSRITSVVTDDLITGKKLTVTFEYDLTGKATISRVEL